MPGVGRVGSGRVGSGRGGRTVPTAGMDKITVLIDFPPKKYAQKRRAHKNMGNCSARQKPLLQDKEVHGSLVFAIVTTILVLIDCADKLRRIQREVEGMAKDKAYEQRMCAGQGVARKKKSGPPIFFKFSPPLLFGGFTCFKAWAFLFA